MIIVNNRQNESLNKLHNVKTNILHDKPEAMAVHITLEAGEELKPHITPVDVFFYVLEGSPTIQVGEEKVQVEKDHLIESPAGIVHCLYNTTDKIARIFVVKTPKPTTSTKVL